MHMPVLVIGENVAAALAPFDENLEVAPYLVENCEECDREPDCYCCKGTGSYMSTSNPQGHWDYWQDGPAAWQGFVTKDGRITNQARKRDIDWVASLSRLRCEREQQWERAQQFAYPPYPIREKETKDEFVGRKTRLRTCAVVKDGVWYTESLGPPTYGTKPDAVWEDEFRTVLDSAKPDDLLTIVDIHW